MKIRCVNGDNATMQQVNQAAQAFSGGQLSLEWEIDAQPLSVSSGDITQDQAYTLAPQERFSIIFYSTPDGTFLKTFYNPQTNGCISCVPNVQPPKLIAFEISHQLIKWYQSNRTLSQPYIEDPDSNFPTDDFIQSNFNLVLPYLDLILLSPVVESPKTLETPEVSEGPNIPADNIDLLKSNVPVVGGTSLINKIMSNLNPKLALVLNIVLAVVLQAVSWKIIPAAYSQYASLGAFAINLVLGHAAGSITGAGDLTTSTQ